MVAAEQRDADDKNAVLITRLAAQLRFTSRENHLPGSAAARALSRWDFEVQSRPDVLGAGEPCMRNFPCYVCTSRTCRAEMTPLFQTRAAYRRHSPEIPFSVCSPRSSNSIPDPATRSLTVLETRTSPG